MAKLDELIGDLRIELTACEDRHSDPDWTCRDKAIRAQIHDLQRERDLLPPQRDP